MRPTDSNGGKFGVWERILRQEREVGGRDRRKEETEKGEAETEGRNCTAHSNVLNF